MCSIASTSRRSVATGVCRASSDWIALLDLDVVAVDVVVEGDHVVRELDVALAEGVQGATQHAQDELALFLEARFELVELCLEADSHAHWLPEPTRHVILGPLVGRSREDLRRLVVLDEHAVSLAVLDLRG